MHASKLTSTRNEKGTDVKFDCPSEWTGSGDNRLVAALNSMRPLNHAAPLSATAIIEALAREWRRKCAVEAVAVTVSTNEDLVIRARVQQPAQLSAARSRFSKRWAWSQRATMACRRGRRVAVQRCNSAFLGFAIAASGNAGLRGCARRELCRARHRGAVEVAERYSHRRQQARRNSDRAGRGPERAADARDRRRHQSAYRRRNAACDRAAGDCARSTARARRSTRASSGSESSEARSMPRLRNSSSWGSSRFARASIDCSNRVENLSMC